MTIRKAGTRTGRGLAVALAVVASSTGVRAQTLTEASAQSAVRADSIVGGGGLQLAIYEAGRVGRPAIVFIHGFSQNSTTWEGQLAGPLSEQFHLVTYDMRGHGASDKPIDAAQYTDGSLWADDLAAVIRARNLHRPVLVGWSYGGYVMADYVRKHGDDTIGGLVFLNAVTKNGTDEAVGFFTDEVLGIFGDVLAADTRRSLDGSRALVDLFARPGSDAWLTAYGSAMMVAPTARAGMFSRVLDNDDVLGRIRVPTLVMHGQADRIVRPSAGAHTARMVPGAKLIGYDGVGHAPHLDDPDRFDRDLAEFVEASRRDRAP